MPYRSTTSAASSPSWKVASEISARIIPPGPFRSTTK
jgi:hypothetical protein